MLFSMAVSATEFLYSKFPLGYDKYKSKESKYDQ